MANTVSWIICLYYLVILFNTFHGSMQTEDDLFSYSYGEHKQSKTFLKVLNEHDMSNTHKSMTSSEHNVCGISRDVRFDGLMVDCRKKGLTTVDQDLFPSNTTSLLLDNNNLTTLLNDSFSRLTSLRLLSMKNSNISKLQAGTFHNLTQLVYLNLEGNILPITERAFPAGLFIPLTNLKYLFIAYNVKGVFSDWEADESNICKSDKLHNYSVCIDIFQHLPHLERLSVDAFKQLYLGHEFTSFVNLTNLTVHCTLVNTAYNNSLEGLSDLNLEMFSLTRFSEILAPILPDGIFQHVSQVANVIIDKCNIGNHNMLRTLWPFVNTTMSLLVLNDTKFIRYAESPNITLADGILTKFAMNYISSICVQHVVISNSKIFAIEPGILTSPAWIRCLQVIDLSGNQMGISGWRVVLFEIHKLENLTEITITSPPTTYDDIHPQFPEQFYVNSDLINNQLPYTVSSTSSPDAKLENNDSDMLEAGAKVNTNIKSTNTTLQRVNNYIQSELSTNTTLHYIQSKLAKSSSIAAAQTVSNYPIIFLRLPKRLQIIRLSYITLQSFIQFRCTWSFLDSENIREIYIRNIPQFLYSRGRIMGFNSLRILDVSGSMLDVEEYAYDDFNSLNVLVMSEVLPPHYFNRIVSSNRLLRNLTNLKYFDLTNNGLNSLPSDVFSTNSKLEYLVLDKNRFSNIPFNLRNTPNLKYLSLMENAILSLDEREMEMLDQHATKVNITLKLQGNAIVCICSKIKFLAWMQSTLVHLDDEDGLQCTSQDGHLTNTTDIGDVEILWRQCVGSLSLVASLVIAALIALGFSLVYLTMRFKLSFMAVVLKLVAPQFKLKTITDYKTNIFIGYADGDLHFVRDTLVRYLENSLGMSTFLHQRDADSGCDVHSLFYDAIHNSWRVLLLISNNFLFKYDMSDKIMRYAAYSVSVENQARVFLLVEKNQLVHIPDYLFNILDDSRIIVLENITSPLTYKQRQSIKYCLQPG